MVPARIIFTSFVMLRTVFSFMIVHKIKNIIANRHDDEAKPPPLPLDEQYGDNTQRPQDYMYNQQYMPHSVSVNTPPNMQMKAWKPETALAAQLTNAEKNRGAPPPVILETKEQQFDAFVYYGQYAAAVYCRQVPKEQMGAKVDCPADICSQLENNNVVTEFTFTDSKKTAVTGLIAGDHVKKTIVITFRGTADWKTWLVNIKFWKTNVTEWCEDCKVHSGFYNAIIEYKQKVLDYVFAARERYPDYGIVLTGHSLGAALATIVAVFMRMLGIELTLITYGQPRICNEALCDFISNLLRKRIFRLTNRDDPIPRLPPESTRYRHTMPEIFITRAPLQSSNDFQILDEPLSDNDSTVHGRLLDMNTEAHMAYVGNRGMAYCSTKEAETDADFEKPSNEQGFTFMQNEGGEFMTAI